MSEDDFRKEAEKAKIGEAVIKRVFDDIFKFSAASTLFDCGHEETDYSSLTVEELINKIRGFLAQEPKDVNKMIFLHYLAKYPVSMCKRDVSPVLKKLIGFHYRFGIPDTQQQENGAEKVSYEDLSEIFVRSKATISECVNQTEFEWNELRQEVEDAKKIEDEARRQLVEEQKQKIREEEENSQRNEQTSERTPSTPCGEDI